MCSWGRIARDGNEIEKRDQGKEQTETGRDSKPPAKRKNIQSRITCFSVSYKSFADTDAFFLNLVSFPRSRACPSVEVRERTWCTRTGFDPRLTSRPLMEYVQEVCSVNTRILFPLDRKRQPIVMPVQKHDMLSQYYLDNQNSFFYLECRQQLFYIMCSAAND